MPVDYIVSDGDCISSIAERYGFFPDTIWNHPRNAALKKLRKDPNILMPGDTVFVPDKVLKQVDRATDARHRFTRKGVPEILRVQLRDELGRPRRNMPYRFDLDGTLHVGNLTAEGVLEMPIPPGANRGKLYLGEIDPDIYTLQLGHLDPIDTLTGIQARLNNLGYDCGSVTGEMNDETRAAIERFQEENELADTGELDDRTVARLLELHKC